MPRALLTAEDVWTRVDVREPDECWLWLGSITTNGYGQFWYGGRKRAAHRVAYEIAHGTIPPGLALVEHVVHPPFSGSTTESAAVT